jgi:hypothetical protein
LTGNSATADLTTNVTCWPCAVACLMIRSQ